MRSRLPLVATLTLALLACGPFALSAHPLGVLMAPGGTPQHATAHGSSGDDDHEKQVRVIVVGDDGQDPGEMPDVETLKLAGHGVVFSDLASRGYLGVSLVDLTPELREHFGASRDAGVLVGKIEPGSPAAKAGLQVGDLITGIDGGPVASSRDLRRHVRGLKDGDATTLEVLRGGRSLHLNATVVEKERPEVDVRTLVGHPAGGEPFVWKIDGEEVGQTLKELQKHFATPEFKQRMQNLGSLEGDMRKRLEEMETQIQELQKQLQEMKREKADRSGSR